MNELKRIVADMESVFAESGYPSDFLAAYDQMECLASHTGRETFLVRRKSDGETTVATCYDRTVFPLSPDLQLLRELDAPGLPRYYEQYQSERMLCIVREYIEGEPLSAWVRDRQLTVEEIVGIARQLCDVLKVLHTHEPPVVHRDIKPENIIIRPDGGVALIDFDIARAVREGAGTDTVFFGTRGYAPPEQYGFGQTDCRADIYAFGVLLRWMVTGSTRENKNIAISSDLQHVIDRCTAFSPQARYGDIRQVKRALGRVRRRRRRILPAAAAVLAAMLLLCAGFAVGRYTDLLRPAEGISFREPLIERAVRLQLGRESGPLTEADLSRVKRLFIYGTQAFGDLESYCRCSIDESTEGSILTLADLALLPNLEELHIVHQGIVDAGGIENHERLEIVELKHMHLVCAAAIAKLPNLRQAALFSVCLYDATPLENCQRLENLDVGLNDIASLAQIGHHPNVTHLDLKWLEMDDVDDIAQRLPKIQTLMLQHARIGDLTGLKALQELREVHVLPEQADALNALLEGAGVQVIIDEE